MQLGGVHKTVQIDKSLLLKAKYHRGRQLRARQRWVFGIYDPEKNEGYIQLVDDRSAAHRPQAVCSLLPIIRVVISGLPVYYFIIVKNSSSASYSFSE